MEPAAKKCLWWALVAFGVGVVVQVLNMTVSNIVFGAWFASLPSTIMVVISSTLWAISFVPLLLAAVLVGVAVVINVLGPRIGPAVDRRPREQEPAAPQGYGPTGNTDGRPDAATYADRSLYEPPRAP